MNSVCTPLEALGKRARMSVNLAAPVPPLSTSCQRVWVPP
jgi:hypothetical protein